MFLIRTPSITIIFTSYSNIKAITSRPKQPTKPVNMRFSTIAVTAFAAFASASPLVKRQDVDTCPQVADIPECGATCIFAAFDDLGCAETDYACGCSQFDELRSKAALCVIGACGLGGAGAVVEAAQAVCDACASP
ncbi:hypothetical protein B0T14DRAFT_599335 [Immersiella caudata]|uniref:CFEM domain-containing protein n=1 Tax=Immersiella caudata TaxID=314043 RepID=A0AA39X227_9PEZI|nr:hypothetical protein B0T14DRAFT_599335 [Immersiella caudata]